MPVPCSGPWKSCRQTSDLPVTEATRPCKSSCAEKDHLDASQQNVGTPNHFQHALWVKFYYFLPPMAIYYTQILNKETKKILSGSFSVAGDPLKASKELLMEMKNAITSIPTDKSKIYSVHSTNRISTFYFKVTDSIIVSSIADNRTTNKVISRYFDEVLKEYAQRYSDNSSTHYEFDDTVKGITDAFNKKCSVLASVEELESTHTALVENLDTLINRGESINSLKDLADKVSMETREMSRKVSRMKLNAQVEQYKIYGVLVVILVLLLFLYFRR